jgi:hypothetical protein
MVLFIKFKLFGPRGFKLSSGKNVGWTDVQIRDIGKTYCIKFSVKIA